jgi:hypothetical protein
VPLNSKRYRNSLYSIGASFKASYESVSTSLPRVKGVPFNRKRCRYEHESNRASA